MHPVGQLIGEGQAMNGYCWCGLLVYGRCVSCSKTLCKEHALGPLAEGQRSNTANAPTSIIGEARFIAYTLEKGVQCKECRQEVSELFTKRLSGFPWPTDPFQLAMVEIALGFKHYTDPNLTLEQVVYEWLARVSRYNFPTESFTTSYVTGTRFRKQFEPIVKQKAIIGWRFCDHGDTAIGQSENSVEYYNGPTAFCILPDGRLAVPPTMEPMSVGKAQERIKIVPASSWEKPHLTWINKPNVSAYLLVGEMGTKLKSLTLRLNNIQASSWIELVNY